MGNYLVSAQDFCKSATWEALRAVALEHGLYPYVFQYKPTSEVDKNSGVYLIVSPSRRYAIDLDKNPDYLNRLLDDKRLMGRHAFNPLYNIISLNEYGGKDDFQILSDAITRIKLQGVAVNAFYECGFMDLPEIIHETTIAVFEDMDWKRHDMSMPDSYREGYDKSFKKIVATEYKKAHEVTIERLIPRSKKQEVSPSYFEEKKTDTSHAPINAQFRAYFEKRIKDFPDFYYCYSSKPTLHLKDLSSKFKGNPNQNRWTHNKEYTEWEITYPACYDNIYYGIALEYNMKGFIGADTKLIQVGETDELKMMHISWQDIKAFDDLCRKNGIKYYINRGDIEEITIDSLETIAIAYNVKDEQMICAIETALFNAMLQTTTVDPAKAEALRQKAIDAKLETLPNRGLQNFYGMGIEGREL